MNNLKIAVPAGIGDTLWLMTKMQSLLRKLGKDKLEISVCSDSLRRADEFLSSFSFVDSVNYNNYQILESRIVNEDGTYAYATSQPNWHHEFDWFLQCNGHLEEGKRLEEWMPELETNWSVFDEYNWKASDIEFASDFVNIHANYVVFYFGPKSGNTSEGHNRGPIWKPEDWTTLGEHYLCKGYKVVVVGAGYDRSYLELVPPFEYIDLVGKLSIGKTLLLVSNAYRMVGYQSGITISAAYLGVKGGGFWRPYGDSIATTRFVSFRDEMASAWVPPSMLNKWAPLTYGRDTVEKVIEKMERL